MKTNKKHKWMLLAAGGNSTLFVQDGFHISKHLQDKRQRLQSDDLEKEAKNIFYKHDRFSDCETTKDAWTYLLDLALIGLFLKCFVFTSFHILLNYAHVVWRRVRQKRLLQLCCPCGNWYILAQQLVLKSSVCILIGLILCVCLFFTR